jgi:hypothetical protein
MAFRLPVRRGEAHPFAKIADCERRECYQRFRDGSATIRGMARDKGIAAPTMHRIVHDPHWSPEKQQLTRRCR